MCLDVFAELAHEFGRQHQDFAARGTRYVALFLAPVLVYKGPVVMQFEVTVEVHHVVICARRVLVGEGAAGR